MKAVVKYGLADGEVDLMEMPEPKLAPDSIILEPKAIGICGTDIEIYHNRIEIPVTIPVILGHEFCGVIAETGKDSSGFKVGDRVVSETHASVCGRCNYCLSGNPILCPERLGFGYGTHGAMAKYVRVPIRCLHRIPENISFEEACMTEPSCVAHNAVVRIGKIVPGDFVVVIGPGPIGLFSLQLAIISGAARVVVIGRGQDEERLVLSRKLGAYRTLNIEKEDIEKIVMDITDGLGANLIIDTSPSGKIVETCIKMAAREGRIVKIGLGTEPFNQTFSLLSRKQVVLLGIWGHVRDCWVRNLRLMEQGLLKMKPLISSVSPITEWKKAFEEVERGKVAKGILTPVD